MTSKKAPVTKPLGPRLLSDDPSDLDLFDGGAHQAIAKAITDLVREEPGGRVIGLKGAWGSGKSTVVGLVCKGLADSSGDTAPSHAFVFDAWAHQGDPLRRTFLDNLITKFASIGWLTPDQAKSYSERLSGRSTTAKTTAQNRLSLEGQLVSAAVILVPLGAVLLGNDFSSHHRDLLYLGLLLMVSPFLAVLGMFILRWIARMLVEPLNLDVSIDQLVGAPWWRRAVKGTSTCHPLSFFASEQTTDTTTEGIEHGLPTSVEFERLFGDILRAAMGEDRRLLLILDNVDRVDEADAKDILATMQTFTNSGQVLRSEPAARRVWTLIPYDLAGLERLWETESVDESVQAPDSAEADRRDSLPGVLGSDQLDTAQAFIDKIFEVQFDVPPLVLSDWRQYLQSLLAEAMPASSEQDRRDVLRVRSAYPPFNAPRNTPSTPPTPRQLKKYVNQIAVMQRLRDDVSLAVCAYFVLLQRDGFDVPAGLLAGSLPHVEVLHLLGGDPSSSLAALHFGTSPDLARQLLFRQALDRALVARELDEIRSMKDLPGFADAVDLLDVRHMADGGGTELLTAVQVLHDGDALSNAKVRAWFRDLLPVAEATPQWSLHGAHAGRGFAILARALASDSNAPLSTYTSRLDPEATPADPDGLHQMAGVASLIAELCPEDPSLEVTVSIPDDRLVQSLASFADRIQNEGAYACLEVSTAPESVANAVHGASLKALEVEVHKALDVLLARPDSVDLAKLGRLALDSLQSQDIPAAGAVAALLDCLQNGPTETVLEGAEDGTLMHYMYTANAAGWSAEAARLMMMHVESREGLGVVVANRSSADGFALATAVLSSPSGYSEIVEHQTELLAARRSTAFSLLMTILTVPGAEVWVQLQIDALLPRGGLEVPVAVLVPRWTEVKGLLTPESFDALIRPLLLGDAKVAELSSLTKDPQVALDSLRPFRDDQAELPREAWEWIKSVVQEAPESDWDAALLRDDQSPLVELTLALVAAGQRPAEPSALANALHTHFQALAVGGVGWAPLGDEFRALTSLLSSGGRATLASQLGAQLEVYDGPLGPHLLPTWGAFLASQAKFRKHAKLPNAVERAMSRNDWPTVAWINGVADSQPDVFDKKGRASEIDTLKARVEDRFHELGGDEAPEELRRLRSRLQQTD